MISREVTVSLQIFVAFFMDGVQLFQGFKTTARKVFFLQSYF